MHIPDDHLEAARKLSWDRLGKRITFYLPGMFRVNGQRGMFPAISITGDKCMLGCSHCRGKILSNMVPALSPERLFDICMRYAESGNEGVLISGGCLNDGSLPWQPFFRAIEKVKQKTKLFISVHSGLSDSSVIRGLKDCGVDQALIDVVADNKTFQTIYGISDGKRKIRQTMIAMDKAGLPMVPHVVCGIDYGRIRGEYMALEMIAEFNITELVIVALMPIPGTPMAGIDPPLAMEIADIIVHARFKMPDIVISLGCARQRGNTQIEELAIDAGVNRMALPSEEAIERATQFGLDILFQPTCCSVEGQHFVDGWL